ncbi:ribosomal prt L18A [Hepatospora eriocheir]|uniref:60S ribosomal protein L20 n=1 Tax=Hepatospora eriocheir TaxID=1081669 RepID=A0A1X0QFY4_9MICR|nr:ribosomal prt L18A [Hepatospora eriocheir]
MFKFSKIDYSKPIVNEYVVKGCKELTNEEPNPQVYFMTVYAKNVVLAEKAFRDHLNQQCKIKSSKAVKISCEEVEQESDFVVKNYGIDFVYQTPTGKHNAHKEIRAINKCCAITTLYQEFGSRHGIDSSKFFIREVYVIDDISKLTRQKAITYSAENLKFPLFTKNSNTDKEFVPVGTKIFE